MKTIIYTCPYVPAEWITAHGLRAFRLLLDRVDLDFSSAGEEGVCPYVRSFIGEVARNQEASGVVVTTLCDQMRRTFDIIIRSCDTPAFLMNVPSTWQTPTAKKLYLDELKRLSGFLIRLGGTFPSKDTLAKIMLEYDDARRAVRTARPYLSARRYAEAIAAGGILKVCPERSRRDEAFGNGSSDVPLAIIGGPLMRPDLDLFDMIEQFGGRIVLDATETGQRGMCPAFDRRRLAGEPLTELANAYFGGIQDASRRPNSELYKWFKQELGSRAVRGIIFRRYLWCDVWHAELGRLKELIELPVLDLDSAGDNETERHRMSNRIRAFLEMLQ